MDENTKILIVEDNPQSAEMLRSYFSSKEKTEVVGVIENGEKALDFINSNSVDVCLLDLIMPNLDGVGLLEKCVYQNPVKKPIFIILSVLKNEIMLKKTSELGAKYFMLKPFDLSLLHKRICELINETKMPIQNNAIVGTRSSFPSIDEKITSIFLIIGIPAHIKGYHFLREAIKLVLENETIINRITKELYPKIAERFETTPSKVERAIRHSIEVAWSRGKIENINQVFGYKIYSKNDKPTNGEFIALMADRLALGQIA